MAKSQTGKWKGGLKLNLIVAGLIVLTLYIGAQIISRTDGFRTWVADKISDNLRQTVTLNECGTTPLLGLRLKELSFEGVEMPDVKVSFNWVAWASKNKPFIKQLRVDELKIRFKRIPATGNWEPLALHELGSRLGAVMGVNPAQMEVNEILPRFSEKAINTKTLLKLSRAQMAWNDEEGRELAYFSDADFNVKTGSFAKRKVLQSIAEFGHIRLASGKLLRDLRVETLSAEGSKVVVILEMASTKGSYPEFATQNLWQDLNEQLGALSNL